MADAIAEEEPTEPTVCDLVEQLAEDGSSQRLWLRSVTPLIAGRSHDTDPSARVQLANDLMHIALCERVSRICRSDMPSQY